MLPEGWRFAQQTAADLARQVEHLAWAGRAEIFDGWLLRQAEAMLQLAGVGRLIDGEWMPGGSPQAATVDERTVRFRTWSRAVVTAVVAELDEPPLVSSPHQALTLLLTSELALTRLAAGWAAQHGVASMQCALGELPGYALVLLAAAPNDTAERFMARDAFWAAVIRRA